jgi:cysteine desulfurase
MNAQTIYLDNAATTPLDAEILEVMLPFLTTHFGNPSAAHPMGQKTRTAIDEARERVAALLDLEPSGVVFTSGGTESNNLAIRGLADSFRNQRLIMTRLEHSSVASAADLLAANGCEVLTIANDSEGQIDLNYLQDLLRAEPAAMLCVVHGSNEIGTVQDIAAIGKVLRSTSPSTWFHVDAVQSIGYLALRARAWGVHSVAVSAHKLHGPKGAGILALFRDAPIRPLIAGGGQEGNRRSGTENTAAIVGAAAALAASAETRSERSDQVRRLRDRLHQRIAQEISGVRFNGNLDQGLPHILSVSFSGIVGEILLHHLEQKGIMVSTGSACHAGDSDLSATLRALGVPNDLARGTIRLSLSDRNSPEEMDRTATVLAEQVAYLREVGLT